MEPSDPRFANLPQLVITTTHLGVKNWLSQLNQNQTNKIWKINEIILPPSDQIVFDSRCNISIVFESQELDYCGDVFNGVYFQCGSIFNGITIPNQQTGTALIFIPYLMPIQNMQCQYEKNGMIYNSICRSQDHVESKDRLLKSIQHEIGHALGLGHYIANSQLQVERWINGTEPVPSIMVSSQEGSIEYAKVTNIDALQVKSIYGNNGFMQNKTESQIQTMEELELVSDESNIPSWIKNVTRWWTEDQISDSEFANGMKYLSQHHIIENLKTANNYKYSQIPVWIKEIARWWSQNQAGDTYFTSIEKWVIEHAA
jgi:nicotinamide mononucleotide adenylyltransferase